jgi:2'-5' RNA ligase
MALIPELARTRNAFRSPRPVPDEQLHMTLVPFPLCVTFPDGFAGHLVRLISASAFPPCRIVLDRVVLGRRTGLLQPSEPIVGVNWLHRLVTGRLVQAGFRPLAAYRFSPHVTLFYNCSPQPPIYVDPISWTAEELVLVHSIHGASRHETLARWPLRELRSYSPEAPSRSA